MLVFGTRPEAVKMCPLVQELRARSGIRTLVSVSGQHRALLDGVLSLFSVVPDYDLGVMETGQTPSDVVSRVLSRLSRVLTETAPDLLLVHGDTATAFSAAVAGFLAGVTVGHVEAGLRTYDMHAPFPEEFNRRAISLVSSLHFAPTARARDNLLAEGIPSRDIFVTGNTAIDALRTTVSEDYAHPLLTWAQDSRLLLLTLHRRESVGGTLSRMFRAVLECIKENPSLKLICPLHPSPAVRRAAEPLFHCDRIRVTEPLSPVDFHNFIRRSFLVLTDSGGVQEEAPSLGVPVLVLRDKTERPEGVETGGLWLVGTDGDAIRAAVSRLLREPTLYRRMMSAKSPYGDGFAARRIADILESLP